jgi:Uma2 family endonuclease
MPDTAESFVEKNRGFTYKDYIQWEDDQRWELIDGVAYNMTPAPSPRHQEISAELMRQLTNFFLDKQCKVYAAPFDVRFPENKEADENIKTVVQPDISVVCDLKKVDKKGCRGAPDLIIEIISPFTARKDLKEKLFLYERAGVKEYWIVEPVDRILMQYKLENNIRRYGRAVIFSDEDKITAAIFPDLEIDLSLVFKE